MKVIFITQTQDNLATVLKSNQSLSVREKNKLKRKVKAFTRQTSHSGNVINDDEAKAGKRSRSSSVSVDSRSNSPACFDNEVLKSNPYQNRNIQ